MTPTAARPAILRPAFGCVAALALLAGCADVGENQARGGAIGAGVGAAVGAIAANKSGTGALAGAGIGLLVGSAVGAYLDAQERELKEDLAGTGADVRRVEDTLVVTLPNGITFDFDDDRVRPEFRAPLRRVAGTLNEYEASFIDVIGHADSTGSPAYNQTLSERRARSVADRLSSDGVNPARLATFGKGETQPVATNATAEGRAANRRVEIIIVPNVQEG